MCRSSRRRQEMITPYLSFNGNCKDALEFIAPIGDCIKLSATVPTGKDAVAIFEGLCVGGVVMLPPNETFYSVFHAAATDKFGTNWNVVVEEAPKQTNG
jgi:uncharacterized glyoxalase superfamily protein PhnB